MKKLLVIFAIVFLTSSNAFALTVNELEKVKLAQKFFDDLKTIQGGFVQLESSTSAVVRGEIFLSKPGKMLMRYVDPNQADFYLVGGRLLIYDYELDQLNHADAESTAFNIFLQPNFQLNNNLMLKVTSVEDEDNKFTIRLQPLKEDDQSTKEIALEFSKFNNQISGFERVGTDNNRFIITFINVKINEPINEKIFVFRDPRKDRKYPGAR